MQLRETSRQTVLNTTSVQVAAYQDLNAQISHFNELLLEPGVAVGRREYSREDGTLTCDRRYTHRRMLSRLRCRLQPGSLVHTQSVSKSGRWRELAAASGVILSLVFVGLQIRQNTAVARGQVRQELAALNQEFLSHLTNEDLSEIWIRAWETPNEPLDRTEALRANVMMTMTLRRIENVYLQFSEGLIDESALVSYGFQRTHMFASSRFRNLWAEQRPGFDPGFVTHFESILGMQASQE